jgi:hypothetical protein
MGNKSLFQDCALLGFTPGTLPTLGGGMPQSTSGDVFLEGSTLNKYAILCCSDGDW